MSGRRVIYIRSGDFGINRPDLVDIIPFVLMYEKNHRFFGGGIYTWTPFLLQKVAATINFEYFLSSA